MIRVSLMPQTGAGEPKIFGVVGYDHNMSTGELTLLCRDGKVCLGLQGSWDVSVRITSAPVMSCEDVERIHDGTSLIVT